MTDENNVGPLIPEARTFALQRLFDDDDSKLEQLLQGISDDEVRNNFWEFINVSFFTLSYQNQVVSPLLKKAAFIKFLSLVNNLRSFEAFFDWYFPEISKQGKEFDEVFSLYWREIHRPISGQNLVAHESQVQLSPH